MAALVSHAMRRYPLSPSDGVFSYNLKVDNITSWSPTQPPDEGESALSRSMRYADPWLYGSVRGTPPTAVVLTPAFVLCSCSEYLTGTKRASQKKGQTVCKKCKGTRLALPSGNGSSKFGTVRCYPTSTANTGLSSIPQNSQARAGTVRITSSSRPSIIPITADPYDHMRRSRLNASSETTSVFRCRSASPSKRSKGICKTTGRRSILECDINPYELMSTGVEHETGDSSITLVNGQRIRIRPPAPDPDYEDVANEFVENSAAQFMEINDTTNAGNLSNNTRSRPNRVAPDPPNISKFLLNGTDQNSRKSILKKSTVPQTSIMQTTKIDRQKAGSQFYLPLPSSPRKKVQFLEENSHPVNKDVGMSIIENSSAEDEKLTQGDNLNYEDVFEENDYTSTEDDSKICTLRRSTSERFKVEPRNVFFLDTMALRTKSQRGDSRDTFNKCDPEKLDGLTLKRITTLRPNVAPPIPPHNNIFKKENNIHDRTKVYEANRNSEDETKVHFSNSTASSETNFPEYNVDPIMSKTFSNELCGKIYCNENKISTQMGFNSEQNILPKDRIRPQVENKLETDRILSDSMHDNNSRSSDGMKNEKFNTNNETTQTQESEASPKIDEEKIRDNEIVQYSTISQEISTPQAPPRKRSSNRQPSSNMQIVSNQVQQSGKFLYGNEVVQSGHEENEQLNSMDIWPSISEKTNSPECDIEKNKLPYYKKSDSEIEIDLESAVEFLSKSRSPQLFSTVDINQKTSFEEDEAKSKDHPKKTVVQITPSSPVHRIQIKNELPELNVHTISIPDNTQRKTSIMINGDDCYSTVNVSDDVPLYQSSVVVRDFETKNYRKSSSVYITGSFNNEAASSDIVSTLMNEQSSKGFEEFHTCKYSEKSENDTKEKKQCKSSIMENSEITSAAIGDYEIRSSTPDMLKEILRDPVEAVKRNLVPHICGKSDAQRRPRDLKSRNYYSMMLSLEKQTQETQNFKDEYLKFVDRSPNRLFNFESSLEDDNKDACSEHSSSTQYEFVDPGSDCYTDHSNRSSVTEEELANRTKFYDLLADSALLEVSENEDHHYESISRNDQDPIYEEIEVPPPLPINPPPSSLLDDLKLDKEFTTRSIFEGASKYDILSYLVDAKERGIIPEDSYTFSNISNEESRERAPKMCHISNITDSSEDNSLFNSGPLSNEKNSFSKSSEVERNDSGVGSETSKSSLSKYRSKPIASALCEDCESALESLEENEPLLCRKCIRKRCERKEIIMEIVETEEKYSRDLQIILEEFYQPMLVAGLLTPEQLATIFLNVEELLENSQSLAERLRDAVEIALEQGDEDLLTVNIGKLFLEAAPMLHAFETYCVRQGPASLLLASLEKEKELLRIFLRVSQMENTLLRRMNLNSFLMVPVQRVTKYPLLLARLYKVTSNQNEAKEQLKESQHKIELHLNHMNSQTKDVPSKLWRRIGSNSGRRSSTEVDLVNIKLRKIAVDVLEWNHEEAKFALEGKLWYTQPTDNNWRKGRTIKLTPVNALLVINGKTITSKADREENSLIFPKHSPSREAALLLVRDKNGRYSLLRDPLYLDRCVIASDPAWKSYFEVQELLGKDTFIFKAEDEDQTKIWYQQLQFHAQGMGSWRKRRNALANIMMNGMGLRL